MPEKKPHVCIVGPSGVGKSPLASLFKLPPFEPFRVRIPRDAKDRQVCKTNEEAEAIYRADAQGSDWSAFRQECDDTILHVGEDWLFFKVRGKMQCLELKREGRYRLDQQSRIEIFAPTLLLLLDKNGDPRWRQFGFDAENTVVIVLNPTPMSYDTQSFDLDSLRQAVFYGITKRSELQQQPVDVPDALTRIAQITEEKKAWVELLRRPCAVEVCGWKHSEFRYHQPSGSRSDAVRELLHARETLLQALNAKPAANLAIARFLQSDVILSADEVQALTDIV